MMKKNDRFGDICVKELGEFKRGDVVEIQRKTNVLRFAKKGIGFNKNTSIYLYEETFDLIEPHFAKYLEDFNHWDNTFIKPLITKKICESLNMAKVEILKSDSFENLQTIYKEVFDTEIFYYDSELDKIHWQLLKSKFIIVLERTIEYMMTAVNNNEMIIVIGV